MALTVLSVAYPFACVSPDAVGGAEQIVSTLDRSLVAAGHRSLVVACEGSSIAGRLLPIRAVKGPIDEAARRAVYAEVRRTLDHALGQCPDVVHLHGIDFPEYLPRTRAPLLATLHLPPAWYPPGAFAHAQDSAHLVCVSASQTRACPPGARLLSHIDNGIALERFAGRHLRKRRFALALGRVCEEKGFHLALDAARAIGMPILLGGRVYPYATHERYFADAIAPRLDRERRFLGPLVGPRKRRLLAAARCLVVPSLAPETSSLVAMEAMASGTPVVAFQSGALVEIVDHGVTGFLVPPGDVRGLADAIARADELDPRVCRAVAQARFAARRMAERYFDLYAQLATACRRREAGSGPADRAAGAA